jgi:menaquinone-specific isochorismate synthase
MLSARPRPNGLATERKRVADPGDLLALLPPDADDFAYVEIPERGEALLACGVAAEVCTAGPARFEDASRQVRALLAGAEEADGPGPIAIGGFAFEDQVAGTGRWRGWEALRLVVPALVWVRRDGELWRLRTWPAQPGTASREPSSRVLAAPTACDGDEDWRQRIGEAVAAIDAGTLRKVVLARTREVAVPADLEVGGVVRRLRDARPGCTTFWLRRGRSHFVGSSPELLARVRGRSVEAVALAGTARRPRRPEDERSAAAALLACAKNAAEHAVVADEVRRTLVPLCTRLGSTPRHLQRLPEVMHLATRFTGTLSEGGDALRVAGSLHPTSAVCGAPRAAALALIRAHEPERGWYAGGVGWMDGRGDGDFGVALRCALLTPGRATLWAGAGIVAGSRADAEWDETDAKMEAVARTLSAVAPMTVAP